MSCSIGHLFDPRSSGRVIGQLRDLHGGRWTYNWLDQTWRRDSGHEVRAYARTVSHNDIGPCEDCNATVYLWTDTGENALWPRKKW